MGSFYPCLVPRQRKEFPSVAWPDRTYEALDHPLSGDVLNCIPPGPALYLRTSYQRGLAVESPGQNGLSTAEIESFKADGFLGPYPMMSPGEMADLTPAIEAVLDSTPRGHQNRKHNRHLDCRLIFGLASSPAIVNRMAALYGPDLLLWRTNFFVKDPGAKRIPWHQDFNYWPLEPPIIASAWIGIGPIVLLKMVVFKSFLVLTAEWHLMLSRPQKFSSIGWAILITLISVRLLLWRWSPANSFFLMKGHYTNLIPTIPIGIE